MIQNVIVRAEHFAEVADMVHKLLSFLYEFNGQPGLEPACQRIAELLDSLMTPGNGF